ncbi:MAG: hypothetical protein IT457_19260 [Planctomycetes bacterium]|nr:hypothetical protein [Planctomycetota bacterium]
MSYATYKLVHFVGLALLLLGVGALHLLRDEQAGPLRKAKLLHGIGLFLMLVGGFGMMARLGIGGPSSWQPWLYAKLAIWTLVGFVPIAWKRNWVRGNALLLATAVAVALSAASALFKPLSG